MKTIILDCDGVLLDWEHGFASWLLHQYHIRVKTARPTSWDLCEWTGLSNEKVFDLIAEFNKSGEFCQLYELGSATAFTRELRHKGYKLRVVSCFDSGGKSVMNRLYNLHSKFGNIFEEVVSLPLRHSKEQVLKDMYEAYGSCIYIEDNHSNAYQGREAGHDTYVLRCQHNRSQEELHGNIKGLTWVDNFEQIIEKRGFN